MEEHYQLLDLLHKHKKYRPNPEIQYQSLRAQIQGPGCIRTLETLSEKIIIAASLDGSGHRGEYQRKNQDWEQGFGDPGTT